MTAAEYDLLVRVWGALRGVGMGAPLDIDYARELADGLESIAFKRTRVQIPVGARIQTTRPLDAYGPSLSGGIGKSTGRR